MKNFGRHVRQWLPVIAWCGIIFYFSGLPALDSGLDTVTDAVVKKIAHVAEYCILCLLVWRAVTKTFGKMVLGAYFWTGCISLLYAISDEIHQSFIPTRNCRVTDVLIDAAGIFLALYIVYCKRNKPV